MITCVIKCGMKLLMHSQTSTITLEVWEWKSNFFPYFIGHMTTYSCWDLAHWGRDKMAAILQTTFSNAYFLNENVCISLKISLKLVHEVRVNIISILVQIMAWRRSGDKPLSEPIMVNLLTHICVTRPQWFKLVHVSKIGRWWPRMHHGTWLALVFTKANVDKSSVKSWSVHLWMGSQEMRMIHVSIHC